MSLRYGLAAAAAVLALSAPAMAQTPPTVEAPGAPAGGAIGLSPFGGTFQSRLDRLSASIAVGTKEGWLRTAEAKRMVTQVHGLKTDSEAAMAKNGGKLSDADNKRLQSRVTTMHDRLSALEQAHNKAKKG